MYDPLHNMHLEDLIRIRYKRKSTDAEDRQIASLTDQGSELDALDERLGLRPAQMLDDIEEARSAKTYGTRPGFYKRLIEPIENGKANAIEAWHPNRLSRNAKDTGLLTDLMDQGKLKAIITRHQIFWNTPNDKFMFVFTCSHAKLENDNKSEDVLRSIRKKLKAGVRPGPAPPGYLTHGESGAKTVVPDPERRLSGFPLKVAAPVFIC